jgi:Mg2+-importing ATPase
LLTATRNPLVILLIVLAIISFATGDARAGTVMSLMVILGVSLRFVQEARADAAAAKLKAMITLTTAVVRAGKAEEIPLQDLAPGDVVTLCAGDMIPADVRIISAKDLFVSQATLTGESLPVEKFDSRNTGGSLAPRVRQYLLPWHKRGERRGESGRGCIRRADLLREHGEQHRRGADRD